MEKFLKKLLPIIILLVFATSANSQEGSYYEAEENYEGWNVALASGFSQFYGDVSQYGFFEKLNNESKLSWSLIIGKEITPWFTMRGQALGGRLKSYQDVFEDGRPANLFIDTKYFEIGANGRFSLDQLWLNYSDERRWQVYGVAGLSFAVWDALLLDQVTMTEIDPNADRNHSALVFPLGLGFEYRIHENWHAFTEWSYRFVASEMVDLVQGGFTSDPILNVGIGVNYKFGAPTTTTSPRQRDTEEPEYGQRAKADPYERNSNDGPDIMEFSPANSCTNVAVNRNARQTFSGADDGGTRTSTSTSDNSQGVDVMMGQDQQPGNTNTARSSRDDFFNEGLTFSVQILAVSKPANISAWKQKYNIRRPVREHRQSGLYRYVAGSFDSYREAEVYADILQNKGVTDAFVVAFRDGQKVRLTSRMMSY